MRGGKEDRRFSLEVVCGRREKADVNPTKRKETLSGEVQGLD